MSISKNRRAHRRPTDADTRPKDSLVTLADDTLTFRHPAVHEDAQLVISLQRTLRVPDDGKTYPLPAGLGEFPIRHVEDYGDRLPKAMRKRGGVLVPMHRAEALWINFGRGSFSRHDESYPMAVQVATGKVCAITGRPWKDELVQTPEQNYAVATVQPWLDGYAVAKGQVRQFVAVPQGEGASVEEQLTGRAEWGGIQLQVFPLRREQWEEERVPDKMVTVLACASMIRECDMGIAPGGLIRQEIYEDHRPIGHWDQLFPARVFIHLVAASEWARLTGEAPPPSPITRKTYKECGIPWFDHYRDDIDAVPGGSGLAGLKSTGKLGVTDDAAELAEDALPGAIVDTGPKRRERRDRQVRVGEF